MTDTNKTADEGSDTSDLSAELADLKAQLDKVNSKNAELVKEKQAMKLKAQEAKDAADAAELTAAEKNGDIEALKAAHAKELKKYQDAAEKAEADLKTIRVDNAIATAIGEGNVKPEFIKAVTAMMKAEVEYANGEATIEGKSIADYAKEYLSGEAGSHFVRAADNSGSGATGNSKTTVQQAWTKEEFLGSRSLEAQKLARDNPAEYNRIVAQVGLPDSLRV